MSKSPRLGLLAVFTLSALTGCSGGSSQNETPPGTDAGDAGDKKDARSDAHKDGAATDAAKDVTSADVYVPARKPGQRTPLSASCDPLDTTRCLLPWPSNTFTVVDTTTETGLRLAVTSMGIGATDDPTSINRADGFSRVTPILTGYAGTLDVTSFGGETTGGVRLIVEQPGATFGQVVPVRYGTVSNGDATSPESAIIAYPRLPLAPNTDYAVVVMDSVQFTDGTAVAADREGKVALGLASPETSAEGALYAYDAPARQAMKVAGVDPTHAVRVWDFTTRGLADPTKDVDTMSTHELAAFDGKFTADAGTGFDASASVPDAEVEAGVSLGADGGTGIGVAIDEVSTVPDGTVAMAVLGRLTGVPYYLTKAGALSRAADGTPVQTGVHDVPFRAAIPAGTGNYHIVMYGHGTGGTYDENSFDQEITGGGAMKVGTQFIGWTASSIINTFTLFQQCLVAADIAGSGLSQSVADTMLVQHALSGPVGQVLGAPMLGGAPNPAAGRFPDPSLPVWAGGSLGGTMGFVYSAAQPDITAAVLNVPGAGWTQFVTYSYLFNYVSVIMKRNYPTDLDQWLAVAEGQGDFDPVDGAVWYDAVGAHHPILLEQESIGDPVLPNIGNELVASTSEADQVGVVLNPIVDTTNVSVATNHTGMSQFKVPSSVTAPLDIHGFAAKNTPAGVAAQQQIQSFIQSVWQGTPVIGVPPECVTNTPANSCDFSAYPWDAGS
jgi:hypothetical protein